MYIASRSCLDDSMNDDAVVTTVKIMGTASHTPPADFVAGCEPPTRIISYDREVDVTIPLIGMLVIAVTIVVSAVITRSLFRERGSIGK